MEKDALSPEERKKVNELRESINAQNNIVNVEYRKWQKAGMKYRAELHRLKQLEKLQFSIAIADIEKTKKTRSNRHD